MNLVKRTLPLMLGAAILSGCMTLEKKSLVVESQILWTQKSSQYYGQEEKEEKHFFIDKEKLNGNFYEIPVFEDAYLQKYNKSLEISKVKTREITKEVTDGLVKREDIILSSQEVLKELSRGYKLELISNTKKYEGKKAVGVKWGFSGDSRTFTTNESGKIVLSPEPKEYFSQEKLIEKLSGGYFLSQMEEEARKEVIRRIKKQILSKDRKYVIETKEVGNDKEKVVNTTKEVTIPVYYLPSDVSNFLE